MAPEFIAIFALSIALAANVRTDSAFAQPDATASGRTPGEGSRVVSVVEDFGADPTGRADSTAAFVAAIAASLNPAIPCGTYLLNLKIASASNLTLAAPACVTLRPFNVAQDVIDDIGGNNNLDTSKNPRTFEADVIPCGMLRGGDHGDGRSGAFRF